MPVYLILTHSTPGESSVTTFKTAAARDRYAASLPEDVKQRTELIDAQPLTDAETDALIAEEAADWCESCASEAATCEHAVGEYVDYQRELTDPFGY